MFQFLLKWCYLTARYLSFYSGQWSLQLLTAPRPSCLHADPRDNPAAQKRLHWLPVRTGVKKDARGAAWNGNQHGGLLPGKHFSVKVQIHIDFVPHKVTYHGSRSQEHWFKTMLVTGRGNFKAKETACLKNAHFSTKKPERERKPASLSKEQLFAGQLQPLEGNIPRSLALLSLE